MSVLRPHASPQDKDDAPPASAAEFRERLLHRRNRFTPRMLEAGGYVIANPHEVAFDSVSTLARQSGLAASTFVRLAQSMGFSGFSEMQRVFRDPLRDGYPASLNDRIRHSQGEQIIADPSDLGALGRSFTAANIASLEHLADRMDGASLEAATDLILRARVIHVIGINRSFAAAAYLSYALTRAGLQTVQLTGLGGSVENQVATIAPGDVLVAISFPPYARETIAVTELARAKGNAILAITDGPVSPITIGADASLLVQDAEIHGFRSLTALLCLIQTLTIGIAFRRRNEHAQFNLDDINA